MINITFSYKNSEIDLLSCAIDMTIGSGLEGRLSFVSAAPADEMEGMLQALGHQISIKFKSAAYDYRSKICSIEFESENSRTLNKKHSIDWISGLDPYDNAKNYLNKIGIPILFNYNALISGYGFDGGYAADNMQRLLSDIGCGYSIGLDDSAHIFSYSDAEIILNLDDYFSLDMTENTGKKIYTKWAGVRVPISREEYLQNGQYMAAGKEEAEDYAAHKEASGETDTEYDLTGIVSWPNYPADAAAKKLPTLSREACLKHQKQTDLDLNYEWSREPPTVYSHIQKISFDNTSLFYFPAFVSVGGVEDEEGLEIDAHLSIPYEDNFTKYFYNIYLCPPDYGMILGAEIIESENLGPYDTTLSPCFLFPPPAGGGLLSNAYSFCQLCKNSSASNTEQTYSGTQKLFTAPLNPGVLPDRMFGVYAAQYIHGQLLNQPGYPHYFLKLKSNISAISSPWNYLFRNAELTEPEEFHKTETETITTQGGTTWTQTQRANVKYFKKLRLHSAKFTPDFDFHDPDDISKNYDAEIASAAETTQRFNPSARAESLASNFYISPCSFFLIAYDRRQEKQIPVWAKTHLNPDTDPEELANIAQPAEPIPGDPTGTRFRNKSEELFLPICRFSLIKNKAAKDPYTGGKHATGIQSMRKFSTYAPGGAMTAAGVYTTADHDPLNNSPENLATGFNNDLNPIISSLHSGETQLIRTINPIDDGLSARSKNEEDQSGELLSVNSSFFPVDSEKIEEYCINSVSRENEGQQTINAMLHLSTGLSTVCPGQCLIFADKTFRIKKISLDFRAQNAQIQAESIYIWNH